MKKTQRKRLFTLVQSALIECSLQIKLMVTIHHDFPHLLGQILFKPNVCFHGLNEKYYSKEHLIVFLTLTKFGKCICLSSLIIVKDVLCSQNSGMN